VRLLDAEPRLFEPLSEKNTSVAVVFDQQNERPLE
jgi:hypothetical protein